MPFIPSDLYLTSATAPIDNTWVPSVSKFTTSSFYNWEQDNLPIYDLEDRTDGLWYKAGYYTSSIPGAMMVVSGDANFVGEASGNIFKNVSSCIKALPDTINYPIIIEIATFGNLGELDLNNIKFGPTGGLEIVNRVFAKGYSASSVVNAAGGLNLSSADIKNTINATSALAISSVVVSSQTEDARWNANQTVLTQRLETLVDGTNELFISKNVAIFYNFGAADNKVFFTIYGPTDDSSIYGYDASTVQSVNSQTLARSSLALTQQVETLLYGNYFTKIKVDNCDGNVFLRNLCVDGATGTGATLTYNIQTGLEVNNSRILLENCSVLRCKYNGFYFLNSKVTLSRGALAYRIYDLSSYNGRSDYESAGIRAVNSEITVSSHQYASGVDMVFNSCRGVIGVDLQNSVLKGGNKRKDSITGSTSAVSFFHTQWNTVAGLRLRNSILDLDGRLDIVNNTRGLEANSSKVRLDEFTFEYNQKEGLFARNSHIIYNKNLTRATTIYNSIPQWYWNSNGQHLVLDNSSFEPLIAVSSMPTFYGTQTMTSSFGVIQKEASIKEALPAVELVNGAKAELVHTRILNPQNNSDYAGSYGVYGAAIAVKDNSKAVFKGSNNQATYIIGVPNLTTQIKLAGLYAEDGSEIELNGPTFIAQYGVDLLAERDSIIKINPHRINNALDVSGYNLTNQYNHTKVELHATRACVVVNDKSTFRAQNLGSYLTIWPNSVSVSAADYNLNDALSLSAYTASGYLQFYPNPQDANSVTAVNSRFAPTTGVTIDESDVDYFLVNYKTTNPNDFLAYSLGGTCVKAMKGSVIDVLDVHFPAGWNNPSGIFYDVSAGTCERLYIWNIGDNSELQAAYCSVSGLYPSLAGYNGPSAVYVSSGGVASGAPMSTPDSSSLSVLDSYGMGGVSGQASFLNKGVFRIYMSPQGPAKFLFPSGSPQGFGMVPQILAQGYNPSSNCSASVSQLSATYLELVPANKFYYVSSMLPDSYRGRIVLDESAANTFANAKNATLGTSGRLKLVTVYRAGTEAGGEGYTASATGYGLGYKSSTIFDLLRDN